VTTNADLSERLRAAAHQWSTVQGIVRYWRRQDLVNIGFHRRGEAEAAAGIESSTLTAYSTPDNSHEHPSGEVFEAVLAVAAIDSGRRRRADAVSRFGEEWMADTVVVDGPTFWARTGDAVKTNGGTPHSQHGGADFICLLTPHGVPDGFDLRSLAETETVAGRPCDIVLALPKNPDPYGETPESEVFDMISGGDSFRLSVDQDFGILVRVVKFVDGQSAEIVEFIDIALDRPLDDGLFQPLS
jgi:hypothetical protein